MKKLILVFVLFFGCGKYIAPVKPEQTAPDSITLLNVTFLDSKPTITWQAPVKQVRGKPLKVLTGYKILCSAVPYTEESFVDCGMLKDNTIEILEKRRDEAQALGQIVRKVKLTEEEKTITWTDVALTADKAYRIVPLGTAEGTVAKTITVHPALGTYEAA